MSLVIKGIDKLQKRLAGMSDRMKDSSKAMKVGAQMGRKDVIQHFESEQGSKGSWPKLKQSTINQRRKGSSKPLQDTGRLKGSIQGKATKNQAIVYTNVKYAKYHDQPIRPNSGKIPQREFMWLDEKTIDTIIKLYSRYIVDGRA